MDSAIRAYPIKFGTKIAMLLTDNVFDTPVTGDGVDAVVFVNFVEDIMRDI